MIYIFTSKKSNYFLSANDEADKRKAPSRNITRLFILQGRDSDLPSQRNNKDHPALGTISCPWRMKNMGIHSNFMVTVAVLLTVPGPTDNLESIFVYSAE